GDGPAGVELEREEEVMRYIGSRGGTPEQIVERVRHRIESDHGALGWWLIEARDDAAFQGVAALLPMPEGDDVELAYRLARASWGRGIATEAATALVDQAFGRVGLPQLVAVTFPENLAALRVLRKVGFQYDGMTDHREFRVVQFPLTAKQWRARR